MTQVRLRYRVRKGWQFTHPRPWLRAGHWYEGELLQPIRSPPSVRVFEPRGADSAELLGEAIDWESSQRAWGYRAPTPSPRRGTGPSR